MPTTVLQAPPGFSDLATALKSKQRVTGKENSNLLYGEIFFKTLLPLSQMGRKKKETLVTKSNQFYQF